MSRAEQPSLKSTMTGWIASKEVVEADGQQASSTSLAIRKQLPANAIVQHAWSPPVSILEEVALENVLDTRLVVLRRPGSAQARSYRLLQHRLLARFAPRVIAVTSARPGEGTTTCAANLALVLSEESLSRVLLVDANLQRPGLGNLFGFRPADSFIARLVRDYDASPPYAVASIGGTQLDVAALRQDDSRDLRLDRLLFGSAIQDLRQAYDYIVIDAPSVFESADADIASECADGVIVTARAGKSRKGSLRRAVEQLSPASVFGAVLLDT